MVFKHWQPGFFGDGEVLSHLAIAVVCQIYRQGVRRKVCFEFHRLKQVPVHHHFQSVLFLGKLVLILSTTRALTSKAPEEGEGERRALALPQVDQKQNEQPEEEMKTGGRILRSNHARL